MKTICHNLKSITLLASLILFSIALQAQSVRGSGNVVEQNRNLSGFTSIEVSSGIDLHIKQGEKTEVVVKADDNLQDRIRTEVGGGVLKITSKGNIRNAEAFDVYVTVKDLEEVRASAGSDVEGVGKLSFDNLSLYLSAGSDVYLEIDGRELYCKLSAGSDANLEGSVRKLDVVAQGGSDLKAKRLEVGDCRLRVSGGSDAYVNVSGDLDMEASGASDIHYTGSPNVVNQRSSGSSDIHGN